MTKGKRAPITNRENPSRGEKHGPGGDWDWEFKLKRYKGRKLTPAEIADYATKRGFKTRKGPKASS
jgi:hypothetical protein